MRNSWFAALAVFITGAACAQAVPAGISTEDWTRVKSSEAVFGTATPVVRSVCQTKTISRPMDRVDNTSSVMAPMTDWVPSNQPWTKQALGSLAAPDSRAVVPTNSPLYGASASVGYSECGQQVEMQPAGIAGYRIVLDYNGQDIVYQSPTPPKSDMVRVRIQVTPVP